ncbi:MAG: hypothetical protein KIT09_00415 [Bryobacteraceae bacterium]|nr:hypothetical protein [Bryobacteraceae bacterium]
MDIDMRSKKFPPHRSNPGQRHSVGVKRSPLTEMLLHIVQPPSRTWKHTNTAFVHDLLLVAALELLQSYNTLHHHLESPNLNDSWIPDNLHEQVSSVLDDDGYLNYHQSPVMTLWSVGISLDNAHVRIAAALDKCVNAWLDLVIKKSGVSSTWEGAVEGLYYNFLPNRLLILYSHQPSKILLAFMDSFAQYGDSSRAKGELDKYANFLRNQSHMPLIDEVASSVAESPLTTTDCAAIIFAQVNSFKHRVEEVPRRKDVIAHSMEIAVTIRALTGVSEFWRVMVDNNKAPSEK